MLSIALRKEGQRISGILSAMDRNIYMIYYIYIYIYYISIRERGMIQSILWIDRLIMVVMMKMIVDIDS